MAPKKAATAALPIEEGNKELQPTQKEIEYIFKVLKAMPEKLQPDFSTLFAELSYANKKSAAVPLAAMGKRLGWTAYTEGAVTPAAKRTPLPSAPPALSMDDDDEVLDTEEAETPIKKTPAAKKTPAKRKAPATPKPATSKKAKKGITAAASIAPIAPVIEDAGFLAGADQENLVVDGGMSMSAEAYHAQVYHLEDGEIYEGPGAATPPAEDY